MDSLSWFGRLHWLAHEAVSVNKINHKTNHQHCVVNANQKVSQTKRFQFQRLGGRCGGAMRRSPTTDPLGLTMMPLEKPFFGLGGLVLHARPPPGRGSWGGRSPSIPRAPRPIDQAHQPSSSRAVGLRMGHGPALRGESSSKWLGSRDDSPGAAVVACWSAGAGGLKGKTTMASTAIDSYRLDLALTHGHSHQSHTGTTRLLLELERQAGPLGA